MAYENITYNGKDIRDALNITPKIFSDRSKQIQRVYGVDLSRYRYDSDTSSSNLTFNPNEFELLKVLFYSINEFPFKTTEAKFEDIDIRKRARNESPDKFVRYIERIANGVDEILQDSLKVHIYTSKVYDETLEWLSARKKLQKSLSDFIKYNDTLDYNESAKRYRELAYRIDEMLFELMNEDIDEGEKMDIETEKATIQPDYFNLKSSHQRFEHYKQKTDYAEDTNRYNHSTEDDLLDFYIVDLLNEIYNARNEKREEIEKAYTNKEKIRDIASHLQAKHEELEALKKKDPIGDNLEQQYEENMNRLKHVVQVYRQNHYKNMDYKDKLQLLKDDQMTLESHEYFSYHFKKFYTQLTSMSLLIHINRDKFIHSNIQPELIDHFVYDTKRIFKIIEKYDLTGNASNKPNNSGFIEQYEKFKKVKGEVRKKNIVDEKIDVITSWSIADKLLENLNHKKHE